jgi:hypothetical protein
MARIDICYKLYFWDMKSRNIIIKAQPTYCEPIFASLGNNARAFSRLIFLQEFLAFSIN